VKDNTIIRPIEARAPQNASAARPKRSFTRDVDAGVAFLGFITALSTLGLSAYFFYGFTQTDQGVWTLASAFGLCFGVGALAYGPCFLTARIALKSRKGRASRRDIALALLLILPWVCVSLIFMGFSALPKFYGFLSLIISTNLCFWAFARLRRLPRS